MARAFADVIRELSGGEDYDDLTTKLGEVVDGVLDTGKVGELTLKLKVKPNGDGSVLASADIKSKVPERSRRETIFFATTGGSLVRNDPRQSSMNFREVSEEARPLKEANHG